MKIIIFVLLVTAFLALNPAKANDSENTKCAIAKMNDCAKKFKTILVEGRNSGKPSLEVYCSGMKEITKCVGSQLQSQSTCESPILKRNHFVLLAYAQMDKLMSTCPGDVKDIKNKVLEEFSTDPEFKQFEDFIKLAFQEKAPEVSECAKAAHKKCVKELADLEETPHDVCFGVTDYILCYQDNKCITDPLSVGFAEVIRVISGELVGDLQSVSKCKKYK